LQTDIANRKRDNLEIALDDLEEFAEPELLKNIENNTFQYLSLIAEAADAVMPAPADENVSEDVFDIMMDQRLRNQEAVNAQAEVDGVAAERRDPQNAIPPSLTRRYEVLILPRTNVGTISMRAISAPGIGSLVSFKGIITQVTDVRPAVTVATYLDDKTGKEYFQEVGGRSFNPLLFPPTIPGNTAASKSTELQLQIRGSKFVKYQEARIQESPDEVPQGCTPRTLNIHFRGGLTRSVKAGDSITVSGVFLPEPSTSQKAMLRSSLLTSVYIYVTHIRQNKQSYQEMELTDAQRAQIDELTSQGDIYGRLANSIAPEIYGHEDVKKALLLAMVGGPTRVLPDGMKLRGDIHACLMGDPGVAKSQLLRYVAYISPRAIYTTGKGSSGVGLTAAVMRDPTTGEMTLEGGALVMADRGICCIDEFDKMEESDRTAIHEVMEQQTVSIAKAGITTTLNTRTTVLSAANPAFGRYDIRRSPAENINLPAALLSRFDILWLILDRPGLESDLSLAQHVLSVHANGRAPQAAIAPLSADMLRAYIAAAKQHEPYVPASLREYIAAVYSELRAEEAAAEVPHSYTTARTLLSLLRLSQSLARLRFADAVEQSDVDEALRLMKMSKASLFDDGGAERAQDPISQVYARIRQHAERTGKNTYSWADLTDLLGTNFKPEQIRQSLIDYAYINVWQLEGGSEEAPGIRLGVGDSEEQQQI
jgi:DNA replication licensing factor MCM7